MKTSIYSAFEVHFVRLFIEFLFLLINKSEFLIQSIVIAAFFLSFFIIIIYFNIIIFGYHLMVLRILLHQMAALVLSVSLWCP